MKYFAPLKQVPGESLLINGNFDIWQRGITVTDAGGGAINVAETYDLADRWFREIATIGAAPTIVQGQQQVTPGELPGSNYFYRISVNGAGGNFAGNLHRISQCIEGATKMLSGTNRRFTLSFYARCNPIYGIGSPIGYRIGVNVAQHYGSTGSARDGSAGTAFWLTGTWQKYIFTWTGADITGKTFTPAGEDSIIVSFAFAWGSNFSAFFGGTTQSQWGGAGNYCDIAQVKFEVGDHETEFVHKTLTEEMTACQRYYKRFNADARAYCFIGLAQAVSATDAYAAFRLDPPMYAVPTATGIGAISLMRANGLPEAILTLMANPGYTSREVAGLYITVAGNLVAGDACIIWLNNDTAGDLQLEAEMPTPEL